MSIEAVTIDGRRIGPGEPPYIVAEMSGNHNHNINRARQLVKLAKEAGVDAIKLQTYTADTMTIDCGSPQFLVKGGPWDGWRLYNLYDQAHTPWEWHPELFAYGRELGITIFSTPFDHTAVDYLEELGAPAYKIASFEVADLALIRRVAATGKPLIISTGMATLAEIADAVQVARQRGSGSPILMHCVSAYPAPAEEANLRTIPHLSAAFDVQVGLSDHTMGTAVATAATALGATIIEKHFTIARADGGVDSTFSLEPHELKALVENTRIAHAALGRVEYNLTPSEEGSIVFRRSLYVVQDVSPGELLTAENIRAIRPGHGISPKYLDDVLGKRAGRALKRGEPLSFDMLIP